MPLGFCEGQLETLEFLQQDESPKVTEFCFAKPVELHFETPWRKQLRYFRLDGWKNSKKSYNLVFYKLLKA